MIMYDSKKSTIVPSRQLTTTNVWYDDVVCYYWIFILLFTVVTTFSNNNQYMVVGSLSIPILNNNNDQRNNTNTIHHEDDDNNTLIALSQQNTNTTTSTNTRNATMIDSNTIWERIRQHLIPTSIQQSPKRQQQQDHTMKRFLTLPTNDDNDDNNYDDNSNIVDSNNEDCEDITLTLFLDSHPTEVGYTLICSSSIAASATGTDDQKINDDDNGILSSSSPMIISTTYWNVTPGTYDTSSYANSVIEENLLCFDMIPDMNCIFNIIDTEGNGLISNNNESDNGYFVLTYGPKTIALYDGTYPYEQLSYCFGYNCNNETTTVDDNNQYFDDDNDDIQAVIPSDDDQDGQDDQDDNMDENTTNKDDDYEICQDMIQFDITFDEFPSEISYTLQCNDNDYIWNITRGNIFTSLNAFESYQNITCIQNYNNDNNKCSHTYSCIFHIYDGWGDGMISPQDKIPGSFNLQLISFSSALSMNTITTRITNDVDDNTTTSLTTTTSSSTTTKNDIIINEQLINNNETHNDYHHIMIGLYDGSNPYNSTFLELSYQFDINIVQLSEECFSTQQN